MADNEITNERIKPPKFGSEIELLSAYLDYNRATLLHKVSALGEEDLRRKVPPNGNSLLGMVKHVAYVERWWFQHVFAGLTVDFPWTDTDPDADWRVEERDTSAAIFALFQSEVEKSRQITQQFSMADISKRPDTNFSLRWIMLHMIEEIARHNGQADIMRELIDGIVGY
jgi:uncharacterized damage-inducible protein DinB